METEPELDVSSMTLDQRLAKLSQTEKRINEIIKNTQIVLNELSKEKQITKAKQEEGVANVRSAIKFVEETLGSQLAYLTNVCVGTTHLGSTFASQQKIERAAECEKDIHNQLRELVEKDYAGYPPSTMKPSEYHEALRVP